MIFTPRVNGALSFIGVALLFLLALAKFVDEDVRSLSYPVNDLLAPWVSSKVFVEGKNPYNDIQEFQRIWAPIQSSTQDPCVQYTCVLEVYPAVYPPSALPLVAPLTVLNWKAAHTVYTAASVTLFALVMLLLAQKMQLPWSDPRKLFIVTFGLAIAPLHAGIGVSNLNTVVIACLIAGASLMERKPYLSGLAIAVAFCLKPQVAFLFFAYPWFRRKWKVALAELVACAGVCAVSLLWMYSHHVDWVRGYLGSMAGSLTRTSSGFSFYEPGPDKFLLVNLQVLAYQFTHSPRDSDLLAWGVFLVLAIVSAYLIFTRVSDKNEEIGIAIISILTLMPIYQRIYTATILIFVFYWALENWPSRSAKAACLLMLPLLVPLVGITRRGLFAGFVERHNLASFPLWNTVFMPYMIWIELGLILILLSVLYAAHAVATKFTIRPVEDVL